MLGLFIKIMKRAFFIMLAGIIAVILILFFKPKPNAVIEPVTEQMPVSTPTNTAAVLEGIIFQAELTTQIPPTIATTTETRKILDVAKAQNLADWTNAMPNIKLWSHFQTRSSWVADQRDTNNYPTMILTGVNGITIQYKTKLTSIDAMGNHVREIELQTPFMDIDETREFGKALLQMMGKDTASFDAWCNKVGNNWIDAPLYDSYNARQPNNDKTYAFGTHITFNNEKPWYIDFIISDP